MALLTQKAFAEKVGVSPQYINRLVQEGKIVLRDRKVDARQAKAAIAASRRTGRVVPAHRSAKRPQPAKAARKLTAPEPRAPRESATRSLTAWRVRSEEFKAKTLELEFQRNAGDLLPRLQVLELEQRKNSTIKSKFRKLPRELAQRLARMTTPAEIEKLLLEEIDVVFDQLAHDPFGMAEATPAIATAVSSQAPPLAMESSMEGASL